MFWKPWPVTVHIATAFPNCSTKNLNKELSHLAFFYGAGSDRILGNDKRVGVPVFTNRKIKTIKKRNTPEWPWVKGQHRIRSARLTLSFLSVAAYGLSKKSLRSDQRQFSLNIDKSKYTSVLKERGFSRSITLQFLWPDLMHSAMLKNTSNFSWGDKLYIVHSFFLRPLRVCNSLPSSYIAILVI